MTGLEAGPIWMSDAVLRCVGGATRSFALGSVYNVVIVAPHPDDETLATALLLAHTADNDITTKVLAVTDGEAAYGDADASRLAETRRAEQTAALAALGHRRSHRSLGLPDGRVSDHIERLVEEILAHATPMSLVVAPSAFDWHPDHVACARAAERATAVLGCSRWSSLFWAHHHPAGLLASNPRLIAFESPGEHANRRQVALACHQSQFVRAASAPILQPFDVAHLQVPVEIYVEES